MYVFCLPAAHGQSIDKLPNKPTGYVSDLATVFDVDSAQKIEDLCKEVDEKAHAQIAVVTVDDTGDEEIQAFTHDLQQKWGVGSKGTDRGITMVFAIKTHKRWIEVSYGLEGILNDAKVGDIGRDMVPQLQAGDYGPAALQGVQAIAQVIAADANVTLTEPVHTYHRQTVRQSSGGGRLGAIVVVLIVLFVFFIGRRGGRGGGGGGGGGSGMMWFLLGSLMNSGGRSSGFSGGSDDGGSSGSDGGGFGGFGGGDSGGGGAGGDW